MLFQYFHHFPPTNPIQVSKVLPCLVGSKASTAVHSVARGALRWIRGATPALWRRGKRRGARRSRRTRFVASSPVGRWPAGSSTWAKGWENWGNHRKKLGKIWNLFFFGEKLRSGILEKWLKMDGFEWLLWIQFCFVWHGSIWANRWGY